MAVNVVALIRLCYLVLLWMMLCSVMTRRQCQWPPTSSFAEASNISPSDWDASSSVQKRILTAFKQGIVEDGHGALASWEASQPLCSWNGVGCANGTHRVVYLNLPSWSLKGTVTPLLFSMPFLTHLNLSGNSLHGSFPDNISTSLEVLDVSSNWFSGSIPASMGNLANLEWLDLSSNLFNGSIPASIGNLANLKGFDLGTNHLSGRIPPQLGNLTNLIHLDLLDNARLEGELPWELRACTKLTLFGVGVLDSRLTNRRSLISGPSKAAFSIFGNMSSLQSLAILGTQVTGSIPAEIGSLKTLQYLGLNGNFLGGEIPRTLGNLSNLQYLNLEFGDFTGPIPGELGSCSQLQVFYVGASSDLGVTFKNSKELDFQLVGSYFPNNLNGSIPESFGQLHNLEELGIYYTQMGGKIPSFTNATALRSFALVLNQFAGHIPSDFASSLKELDLNGNRLSGPVPPAIGNFSYLEMLQITEDDMEGNIPPDLAFCQNLRTIVLGSSKATMGTGKLTGPIPDDFGRLNRLQQLLLTSRQLSGTIPSSLGNCSSLMRLSLRSGQLVGSLPPEIANLTALMSFDVSRNRLKGSLSAVRWNELRNLAQFVVSQNIFSGTIPESLGHSVSLWYFSASYNQLVGTLPMSFINCSSLTILDMQSNQMEGNISQALEVLCGNSMSVILLATNRFYGTIPPWIASRFKKLFLLVLGGNLLEGTIPPSIWQIHRWQQPYPSSDPLSAIARGFFSIDVFTISSKGNRTPFFTVLPSFTVLDLSGNNLQGILPEQLFNLSGLSLLNLSNNHFTGEIPRVSNTLNQIDISHNNLTGEIPAITLASFKLDYLDLSSNGLCGPIPNSGTKFDRTYFMGNPCLCGLPLDVKCPPPLSTSSSPPMSSTIHDAKASLISWIAFSIGCASSFLVTMIVFLSTSTGSYFIFDDIEPSTYIRRHGLYKEP